MTTEPAEAPAVAWANRITRFEPDADPSTLQPNPLNPRRHPPEQLRALRESLDRVGWVGVALFNERTGNLVDGHARVEEALEQGSTVPTLYVDLSAEEEALVLATLDPITAMAQVDAETMALLTEDVQIDTPELRKMIEAMAVGDEVLLAPWTPPERAASTPGDEADGPAGFSTDGRLLDLAPITLAEPTHQPKAHEKWRLGMHRLVVADLLTEWSRFVDVFSELGDEALFVPYPGPWVVMSQAATTRPMLLVQPNPYTAGHLLDTWSAVYPDDPPELI